MNNNNLFLDAKEFAQLTKSGSRASFQSIKEEIEKEKNNNKSENLLILKNKETESSTSFLKYNVNLELKSPLKKYKEIEYSLKPIENFIHPLYSSISPREKLNIDLRIPKYYGQCLFTQILSETIEKIPIAYSEPITTLQRQCEKFQFSYLLKKASLLYSQFTN